MDNIIIFPLIKFLQNLPVEISSLLLLIVCIISILSLFKLFGEQGLCIHSIVAIISANIQVLKVVQFNCYSSPVALGTIVFASTYLCSGILSEHFGEKSAKNNVWYCFAAQILITLLMLITIGHKPLVLINHLTHEHNLHLNATSSLTQSYIEHINQVELALKTLFSPLPRFLFASLISFIVSQKIGIFIFNLTKKFTFKKYIWLRTMALLTVSTTIDTFLFNLLAWKFLSPNPLCFTTILHTYIICTLITQGCITILSTPIVYLSYFFKPVKSDMH